MKYSQIDPELFIHNRANFVKQLKPCSLAVFHSNDVMPTNADGTMAFRQNNDLFYLSGVDQEESILLLFPESKDARLKEILFVRETSDLILTWEGYKLTKEQAEIARLKKELAARDAKLATTQTALDIMGKAHALLEQISKSADSE